MSHLCLLAKSLAAISRGNVGSCPWCWMRLFILCSGKEKAQMSTSRFFPPPEGTLLISNLKLNLERFCFSFSEGKGVTRGVVTELYEAESQNSHNYDTIQKRGFSACTFKNNYLLWFVVLYHQGETHCSVMQLAFVLVLKACFLIFNIIYVWFWSTFFSQINIAPISGSFSVLYWMVNWI